MFVWISSIWLLDLTNSNGITIMLREILLSKTKLKMLALRSTLLCMIYKSMMLHLVTYKNLAGKIQYLIMIIQEDLRKRQSFLDFSMYL